MLVNSYVLNFGAERKNLNCSCEIDILLAVIVCIEVLNSATSECNACLYRVIQEELRPIMELISKDILSKKCHINLGPILNIYRVTFIIGNAVL
jgi:hypothetical protein